MLLIRKPTPSQIESFLQRQADCDLTYQAVGATAASPPSEYVLDHTRVKLGNGEPAFQAACEGLRRWRQFDTGWLETWSPEAPLLKDQVIAIVARYMGFWWLNACRIVYVHEPATDLHQFGFAYGTLPAHAGTGEERFLVEMDERQDVWYDILAFSRPRQTLARLGYPLMRGLQKRFGRDSSTAMQRFVTDHQRARDSMSNPSR